MAIRPAGFRFPSASKTLVSYCAAIVGIPVVDVDVRSEAKDRKNPRQQAIESVTLRLFHPAVALQTSLIALTRLLGATARCHVAQCHGVPARPASPPPQRIGPRSHARSHPSVLAGRAACPRHGDSCAAASAFAAPGIADYPASPMPAPLSVGNPAEGSAATGPAAAPPAQKRVMPWSIRLGIAGLATGLCSDWCRGVDRGHRARKAPRSHLLLQPRCLDAWPLDDRDRGRCRCGGRHLVALWRSHAGEA